MGAQEGTCLFHAGHFHMKISDFFDCFLFLLAFKACLWVQASKLRGPDPASRPSCQVNPRLDQKGSQPCPPPAFLPYPGGCLPWQIRPLSKEAAGQKVPGHFRPKVPKAQGPFFWPLPGRQQGRHPSRGKVRPVTSMRCGAHCTQSWREHMRMRYGS